MYICIHKEVTIILDLNTLNNQLTKGQILLFGPSYSDRALIFSQFVMSTGHQDYSVFPSTCRGSPAFDLGYPTDSHSYIHSWNDQIYSLCKRFPISAAGYSRLFSVCLLIRIIICHLPVFPLFPSVCLWFSALFGQTACLSGINYPSIHAVYLSNYLSHTVCVLSVHSFLSPWSMRNSYFKYS